MLDIMVMLGAGLVGGFVVGFVQRSGNGNGVTPGRGSMCIEHGRQLQAFSDRLSAIEATTERIALRIEKL